MGHPAGLRAGTRYAFSRNFREKGMIKLSTYLRQYRVGDIVDIKTNGAVQKGWEELRTWAKYMQEQRADLSKYSMPHKVYHGKTGVIYNVTKSAVGIIIYKKVKHRYIEKRINIRVEHISPSRSRDDFIRRVKENAALKKKAQAEGKALTLKRLPLMPRDARTVDFKENKPQTVTPLPYETTI
ncbi:ribosomal protein L21e [Colletotrichum salicis]|uniref:Ribosomal protein L21e n=1 Tax=Colletotrichum salicis TaxID=1209931 RepID=A0A135UEZ8_9PEZI|nr:ribosomal protein L21e [Colletotrichum salicis]